MACTLDAQIPTILGHQGTIVPFRSEQWRVRNLRHPHVKGTVVWLGVSYRGITAEVPDLKKSPYPRLPIIVGRTGQIAGSSVRHSQGPIGLRDRLALNQWAKPLSYFRVSASGASSTLALVSPRILRGPLSL